jgi:hypothetical protein
MLHLAGKVTEAEIYELIGTVFDHLQNVRRRFRHGRTPLPLSGMGGF